MKYLKNFEKYKTQYPIKFKVGDYVFCKWYGSAFKVTKIRKRVGRKPTSYFLDGVYSSAIEDEDDLRLATPEEIEEYELRKNVKNFNL